MHSPGGRSAAAWHNWAGNVTASPTRVVSPGSAAEVTAEISRAAGDGMTVRMTGTGHSFTPAAVTDDVQLRPDRLTGIRSVDSAARTITVEAGCPLRLLNAALLARGLSLANMGDIQVQTVAGATQTGTHGTGRDVGGMSAQIAGLELALADGSVVTCSADSPGGGLTFPDGTTPNLFDAARVGLGALGVVTAITFRVVPAFLLEAREEPMTWSAVMSHLDEFTSDNEHFEFYWFPHSEGCLTKRNNRTDGAARPLPRWRYLLDDELLSNSVFGLTCQLGRAVPAAIPVINSAAAKALGTRTYTDAAYKVFTSPRRVRFKEEEYAIPRAALSDVLAEVRALFRRRDWRISFPIEVRVSPSDDVWLSTAYGRDSAYIAIHVFHSAPHEQYFADVEAVMTSVGGRPHWGKMHTRDADYLAGAYPRLSEFLAVRDLVDPDRRFTNGYLRQVLGS
ncbi:MAG TPA: D-arabinono-1,4-lactone oxidase [Streptosporangiaceae bacterium]|nr:D-arabinono-1,4-lactone oxidase [Streptosporangiaceae bacterium]